MFLTEHLPLVTGMCRAAIAEIFSSARLDKPTGSEASAGDCDERVAMVFRFGDTPRHPSIEGQAIPIIEAFGPAGGIQTVAGQTGERAMNPREGLDVFMGQTFPLQTSPGIGGVDRFEVLVAA